MIQLRGSIWDDLQQSKTPVYTASYTLPLPQPGGQPPTSTPGATAQQSVTPGTTATVAPVAASPWYSRWWVAPLAIIGGVVAYKKLKK